MMLLTATFGTAVRAANSAADASFDATAEEFVRFFHDSQPLAGVALGWHQYDGKFVVSTAEQNAAVRRELHRFQDRFSAFPPATLSPRARRDRSVIENRIGMSLLFADRLRWTERSPLAYADQPDISIYLKRDWKPLADRVRDITAILQQAPAHFAAARTNLEPRLPKPWIELAIQVAEGTASFWENEVSAETARVDDTSVRAGYTAARTAAVSPTRWRRSRSDDRPSPKCSGPK